MTYLLKLDNTYSPNAGTEANNSFVAQASDKLGQMFIGMMDNQASWAVGLHMTLVQEEALLVLLAERQAARSTAAACRTEKALTKKRKGL